MDELNFKFIYNGEDSFLDLMNNIRFNTKADRIGRYWKGVVKVDGKSFIRSEGSYIVVILLKLIEELKNKENVVVEMNLHSP